MCNLVPPKRSFGSFSFLNLWLTHVVDISSFAKRIAMHLQCFLLEECQITTQLSLGAYPTSSISYLLSCFLMAMPWLRRAGRLTPLAAAVYSSDVKRWRTQADVIFCVASFPRIGMHWI